MNTTIAAVGEPQAQANAAHRPTVTLEAWTVISGPDRIAFQCLAENVGHALAQCQSAYPGAEVISAQKRHLDNIAILPWDHTQYGGSNPNGSCFDVQLVDQRYHNGQLYVDVASDDGDFNNVMSMCFEIGRLNLLDTDGTQCAHLHFNGDNLAVSIFKQADKYILRPENGVRLYSDSIDGERVYILE
jgi:hypothetical protein